MEEQLRLGVVGANPSVGWASRTHMPALLALPEFDLAAVCTTKRESAEAAAQKYEAPRAYWDYRDLVADADIDVVDVCVRVPYHFEIARAALEAGKHVYCEWPLALTVAQAVELTELADRKALHTMVGLQARGAPSILHLHQLISDGWIGRVMSATMSYYSSGLLDQRSPDFAWRADRTNGANTLSIAGGHSLDTFCWCVGAFAEVAAIVETLSPEWRLRGGGVQPATAPDHVSLTGRLNGGGVATVIVSSVPSHGSPFRMEIYGSEGTIVATSNQGVQAVGVRLQGARRGDPNLVDLAIPAELHWAPAEVPDGTPVNLAQMMRRFADGIRADSQPQPSFADAVRTHRLLEAIERSSETGRAVKVDL